MVRSKRSTKFGHVERSIQLIALLSCLCASNASAREAYFYGESITFSEPTSIHSFLHDWNGSFENGTHAFSYNSAEFGVNTGTYSIGAQVRYDYALEFSEDTASYFNATANDIALERDRDYHLKIEAEHFTTSGIRFARTNAFGNGWSIKSAITVLYAWDLLSGNMHGTVLESEPDTLTFNATADYYYREDPFFRREVPPPEGQGATLDIALEGKLGSWGVFRLKAIDLLGAIWWHRAPHTVASAESTTSESVNPLESTVPPVVSGREGFSRFRQSLPTRGTLETIVPITSQIDFSGKIFYTPAATHYLVGITHEINRSKTTVRYNLSAKAIEIESIRGNFQFAFGIDNLDYKDAHYLSCILGYSKPF